MSDWFSRPRMGALEDSRGDIEVRLTNRHRVRVKSVNVLTLLFHPCYLCLVGKEGTVIEERRPKTVVVIDGRVWTFGKGVRLERIREGGRADDCVTLEK